MTKHGTAIGWTHPPGYKGETWTVIRGCQLPPGRKTCVDCYAMVTAHSLVTRKIDTKGHYAGLTKMTSAGPIWTGAVNFDEEQLLWPMQCTKPRCFFLTSMGDLYYKGVTRQMRAKIVAVMQMTPRHIYLVLTKRPDVMAEELRDKSFREEVIAEMYALGAQFAAIDMSPKHIWWGCSIEDKPSAGEMLPALKDVPAPRRRFISYEPMIEYVNLAPWIDDGMIDWVILGGASKQRLSNPWPFDLDDALTVLRVCKGYSVPVFVKQLGARPRFIPADDAGHQDVTLREHNGHNSNPDHWPEDLRVQQFPEFAA